MSYCLVLNSMIQTESGLPFSSRRLSDGAVINDLRNLSVAVQQSCGWYQVADVAQPADTATHTTTRTLTLVGQTPTVTWVSRLKTAQELADAATAANEVTVNTFLTNAVATNGTLDLIIGTAAAAFTQQGLRDLQAQVKDIARVDRREIRKLLRLLEATT